MSGLGEFVLARVAEDEAVAQRLPDSFIHVDPFAVDTKGHPIYWPRRRLLAECAAKRRIVAQCLNLIASFGDWDAPEAVETGGRLMWTDVNRRERSHAHALLEILAEPYSDHPDYEEATR